LAISPSDYKLKVLVGIPFAGRYVPPEWSMALTSLIWPMNTRYAMTAVNCSRHPGGTLTREQAREKLVQIAIDSKAQYIWMLDDDTEPPPESIVKLIRALEEHPEMSAVGGIYPRRAVTCEPMVFLAPNMGAHWTWKAGQVFECAEIGTGCLLIRTSVFANLPKPWFRDINTADAFIEEGVATADDLADDVVRGAMTDDIYFCRKLTAHGGRILAHGGVLCRHWGRNGDYYEIPQDSYPFQSTLTLDKFDVRIRSALVIDGWMSPEELLWLAEKAEQSQNLLEIGSWKGRSARALAENTKGHLTCIDTWGPSGDVATAAEFAKGIAENKNNPDWLWDEFRINMIGLDNVGAIRKSSIEAVKDIPKDMRFDLIFIDGAHDAESVKADIRAWEPFLAPNGVLCGHDYDNLWPGVKDAVNLLFPNAKNPVGSIWVANPL